MSGVKGTHSTHNNVFKIGRAAQGQVCATALVCHLLVALVAGSAREEEPALQGVAPGCRLVDEITCREEKDKQRVKGEPSWRPL